MKHKLNVMLISGAGVLLILSVAIWFLVPQPNQQNEAIKIEGLLQSGIKLFKEKKYNETLETLALIPSGSAQETRARYYQGSAYIMLKDYESAIGYLEQALTLDGKDVGVLYSLGVTYYKLGNIKLAKSYFASVLEINPNDEQAKGLFDIMAKLERNSTPENKATSGY
jgi:tetratricopeptide (TPR) repeat protein